jgi:cell division protein FtsB
MKTFTKKRSIFLRVALIALAIYVVVSLIQLQLQLDEGQRQLDSLSDRLANQLSANAELQDQIDNYESYLEQQARKQGMAKPGETILIEIPED